jgi:hypothetical protein
LFLEDHGKGLFLRNIADIEKYVNRNTPVAFPAIKKYLKKYIESLLLSEDVVKRLAMLEAFTNTDIPDTDYPYNGMLFIHRELHPLVARYSDYKYQYLLAYSRLYKDETLCQMLVETFFGPGVSVFSNVNVFTDAAFFSDEMFDIRSEALGYKATDQGFFTDVMPSSLLALVFSFDCLMDPTLIMDPSVAGKPAEEWLVLVKEAVNMFFLTLPARLLVVFHAQPCYYIGRNTAFDLVFKVEGDNLIAMSNSYDVDDFILDADGNLSYIYSEEPLLVYRDGDYLYVSMDGVEGWPAGVSHTLVPGMVVKDSPFNDTGQMDYIKDLIDAGKLSGIYNDVTCEDPEPIVTVENSGFKKVINILSRYSLSSIHILPGDLGVGLNEISLQVNTGDMPFFGYGRDMYGIKLFVDFE